MNEEWRNENWPQIANALEELLEQVKSAEENEQKGEENALPQ